MQVNQQLFALYTCANAGWNEDYCTENRIEVIRRVAELFIIIKRKKMAEI